MIHKNTMWNFDQNCVEFIDQFEKKWQILLYLPICECVRGQSLSLSLYHTPPSLSLISVTFYNFTPEVLHILLNASYSCEFYVFSSVVNGTIKILLFLTHCCWFCFIQCIDSSSLISIICDRFFWIVCFQKKCYLQVIRVLDFLSNFYISLSFLDWLHQIGPLGQC